MAKKIAKSSATDMKTVVNFYDSTGSKIIRTRIYETRAKAWAAIVRAQKSRQIAGFAAVRTSSDQPSVHH